MNEYTKHFQRLWSEAGGLIHPTTAAAILGVSRARIANMQKQGKLKIYEDKNGKTMLSMHEVNGLLIEKNQREKKPKNFIVTYSRENDKNNEKKEITIRHETSPDLDEIMLAIQKDLKRQGLKLEEDNTVTMRITQDFDESLKEKITLNSLKKGSN